MGTTALVLGICAAVFAFIPLIGIIAWPLLIIGGIFGHLGRQKAANGTATNSGSANAGLILCGIALLVCIGWVAAFTASWPTPG